MNCLLPGEVLSLQESGSSRRSFEAAVLFLDISGFTPLTESLMRGEKGGAELLADIVNEFFCPVIAAVYRRGGYVSGFAGDAFTAVFPASCAPADAARRAFASAAAIREVFVGARAATPEGDFPLAVKQGLALGLVECGVAGDAALGDARRAFFHRGPAIDSSAAAEHRCEKGSLVLDSAIAGELGLRGRPLAAGFFAAETGDLAVLPPPALDPAFPSYAAELAFPFFPRELVVSAVPGEFRQLACLFLSFRDIAPDELDGFVGGLLREVDARGGYFNRLDFGDKGGNALIFFGAPAAHENDLERALDCALSLGAEHGNRLRFGITRGPLYFGRVGIPERCEVTALGEAVNLAARLMLKADWGEALASEPVARHGAFAFESLGKLELKGFALPPEVYRLLRRRDKREAFFSGKMVGRDGELRALLDWASPIMGPSPGSDSFGRVALLYGEAGMGKSRLCFELRSTLKGRALWLTGHTDSILRPAFSPFAYLLRGYFGQEAEASAEENRDRFETRFASLERSSLPPATLAELGRTRSFLGALLGLRWPSSLYEQLSDAKLRYENTLSALVSFLLALSHDGPLVIELEDVHWLDDASRELLVRLTRQRGSGSMLLLMTSRFADDGSRPPLALGSDWPALDLELRALSAEDLRSLSSALLRGEADRSLASFVEGRSLGVPFFAEQILAYLQESGAMALDSASGLWRLGGGDAAVPDSLSTILVARLDRLGERVKRVVQTAAVLGREFDARLLPLMLGEACGSETDAAEAGLIWSSVSGTRYLFRHALLRDAAYDMQLRSRLTALHLSALKACEDLYSDDLPAHADELAFHADYSGDEEKKRRYFSLAGDLAQAGYRSSAALEYYGRLEPLLAEGKERLELYLKRGAAYELLGQRKEAETAFRAALDLSGADAADRARCARSLGKMLVNLRGDLPAALVWLTQARDAFIALGDIRELALTRIDLGGCLLYVDSYDESQRELSAACEDARSLGEWFIYAQALGNMANSFFRRGEYEEALRMHRESVAILREHGDKRRLAFALINLGTTIFQKGELEAAREHFEQSLGFMREIGDRRIIAILLNNLGVIAINRGDRGAARSLYDESLGLWREMGNRQGVEVALFNLGFVAVEEGDFSGGRGLHAESLAIAEELSDKFYIAYGLAGLAAAELGLGSAERAARLASAAKACLSSIKAEMEPFIRARYERTVSSISASLGEARFEAEWASGAAMPIGEAVRYALGPSSPCTADAPA
jgi:Predicted ATPase